MTYSIPSFKACLVFGVSTFFSLVVAQASASSNGSAGMVASIAKAPVVADLDVRERPNDYVITFDTSLDPSVPGRALAAGDIIKLIFPQEFDLSSLDSEYPLLDIPVPGVCVPGNFQCSTAVILQGWPQHPLFPPAAFASLSIDPLENALVFTATQDIVPNPPANPGIKQIHLIMNGLANPGPGNYRIRVEAQTGEGGGWESGSGLMQVLPKARPSINVTSVLVKATSGLLGDPACGPGTLPPNPDNPIYQTTYTGSAAPFVWTFLLWGKNAEPLDDVSLEQDPEDNTHWHIRRGMRTVGHVNIDAPWGASGHWLQVNPLGCPTLMPAAPVIGATPGIGPQPVGRLDIKFYAGSHPGLYTTTLSLNNGNSVQMYVDVQQN